MGTIIAIIASILIAFGGGFFVGERVQAVHDEKLPPKTQIENTYTTQNVETKSTSTQIVSQDQTTMVIYSDKTNFKYISINGNGKTNYSVYISSKTNVSKKTNRNK